MTSQSAPPTAPRRYVLWAVAFAAIAATGVVYWQYGRWKFETLLAAAETSFAEERYDESLQFSLAALRWRSDSERAWLIAAKAQFALGRYALGITSVEHVSLVDSPAVLETYTEAARSFIYHLDQPTRGETIYRAVLDVAPNHEAAIAGLADLLGLTGRRWEAIPYIVDLIRLESFRVDHLYLLAADDGMLRDPDLWSRWLAAEKIDALAHLARARHLLETAETAEIKAVVDHLQQAIELNQNLVEAHALLGSVLVASHRLDGMHAWHSRLPTTADVFPSIWLVRAQWAEVWGETEGAIRCYAEALKRNPNLSEAAFQIGQLLHAFDKPKQAAPFLKRNQNLRELAARETVLNNSVPPTLRSMRRVAEQLAVLGRVWEARGWSLVASKRDPDAAWIAELRHYLSPSLKTNPPWTLVGVNPVRDFEIETYPLPKWESLTAPDGNSKRAPVEPPDVTIRFADVAAEVGIDFQYFNSGDPDTPGQYMYEFAGGGVAVLDYDGDRWPDLYFTQGCRWPVQAGQHEFLDRFYRNSGTGTFQDVTEPASIVEDRFSQGVAAGDVNNDGFPDLFIANIGQNRLLINNGDGTFDEQSLPEDPGLWTTSCAIADLNGDSWPDIYAANYLNAPDIFTRMCRHGDGAAKMCAPIEFSGSPDEFYLNLGDGTFAEASHVAGFYNEAGKGLGVAIADFDNSGNLDVFVANDLVENFYFVNETPLRGVPPNFSEQGIPLGVAYGAEGGTQGCMGIAVGDVNGDQRLDMFVTNFLMEPNAFYVQLQDGFFTDLIHQVGLYNPSMYQLGFGTQFLDADLDGRLDLIVSNGHIDDERAYGRPFHMPPQFFYNTGQGRFRELPAGELGRFFEGAYLGRGLAKCDWNRDGAEDIVISHLDSPAALLTNTSLKRGHFVAVHLRGTTSARDAIGTTLRLKIGDEVLYRQLTAGDGYFASNERLVVFGLGEATSADELEIRWPSGEIERFDEIPINRHVLLIEGDDRLRPCN